MSKLFIEHKNQQVANKQDQCIAFYQCEDC